MKASLKPKLYALQKKFNELWLYKRPEYEQQKVRCMWQNTRGIPDTAIIAMECWLIGPKLYIVQYTTEGFNLFEGI